MERRFLQEGNLGRVWVTRLMPGDELEQAIIQVMQEAEVERAVVVSAVGSLRDVVLRAAKQGARLPITPERVNTIQLPGPFELLSLEGMIVPGEEGPFCHLHPTLGAEDGSVWGGHLLQGAVFSTVELVLGELVGSTVVKRHSEQTGLAELQPE